MSQIELSFAKTLTIKSQIPMSTQTFLLVPALILQFYTFLILYVNNYFFILMFLRRNFRRKGDMKADTRN